MKKEGINSLLVKCNDKFTRAFINENIKCAKNKYLNNSLKETKVLPNNMIIDVIVPIYNAYDFTKRCILSIYKNTTVNYNLYLINDCSSDIRIGKLLQSIENMDKPHYLKNLYIVENETNLGFIKTVNKAISLSENHIVLLNTDTEVPNQWLERLIEPLVENNNIASITPFSNCATICSFPNFCEDNNLPENISLSELDCLFSNYGGNNIIDVPTGVGFCMVMNRECISKFGMLDTIYGKGYGEENDWCRRMVGHGYRNVMITNLFVYHKHGVSFSEQKDKSKQEREEENIKILSERYPDYMDEVNDFIAKDPIRSVRNFLYYIYKEQQRKEKDGVLFINHSCGGGATVYQNNLINKWKKSKRIYTMELLSDLKTLRFSIYQNNGNECFYFDLTNMNSFEFIKLTKAFNITCIYINQLVTYPAKKIIQFIEDSKLEYIFFVHDYYSICPGVTLLNYEGRYCNAQKDVEQCNYCLKKYRNPVSTDIESWRNMFYKILLNAQEVIVPSQSTADILKSYYPNLMITIKEHDIPQYVHKTFNKFFIEKEILNVAIVGAIGENKGSKIVYELAEKIQKENLPIHLKVIGITNIQDEYYKSHDNILEITGRYNNKNISDLLAKYQIGLVLIPSISPETYSYTASEAIFSGYPVMVFNIGAPAERVKLLRCGWIVEGYDSQSILIRLKKILSNKEEIMERIIV